jgi:predicted lipoprotein with Yx(FWY)xxD motif
MRRTLALITVSAFLAAACGGGGGSENGATAGGSSDSGPATVEVRSTELGDVLVDGDGMTLYMFVPDQKKNGRPTCYDECAEAWPALEAPAELTAGDGLDGSLLGTVKRDDGTTQVTYGDLPLYLFSGDQAAGDVEGQGLNEVWYVLSPEGKPVKEKTSGASKGY